MDDMYDLYQEMFLRKALEGRFTVKNKCFYFAEDFLDAVRSQGCDLASISLNDVSFRDGETDFHKRMSKAVGLIPKAKEAGAKLVFASTTFYTPELAELVRDVGADSFLRMLFYFEDYKRELDRCMWPQWPKPLTHKF
jgi:hypothetical protein